MKREKEEMELGRQADRDNKTYYYRRKQRKNREKERRQALKESKHILL